jgi:hypothetical protein
MAAAFTAFGIKFTQRRRGDKAAVVKRGRRRIQLARLFLFLERGA